MKRFLLAGATLLALTAAQPTLAADAPVYKGPAPIAAALFNWSGFYIGVNGGWAGGTLDWVWVPPSGATNSEGRSMSGGLVGGHAGFQWQFNTFVLGAEVNALASQMNASPVCIVNAAFRCGSDVNRLWTVGPRAGFAANNVLFYGTGGYAAGQIYTDAVAVATGALFESAQQWHSGWFVGVGVEYSFTPNVIAGIEATHVTLNTKTHLPVTPGGVVVAGDSHDVGARFTAIRARLSFKFGGPH